MKSQICFYLMSQSQHKRVISPQSQSPISRATGDDANLPANTETIWSFFKQVHLLGHPELLGEVVGLPGEDDVGDRAGVVVQFELSAQRDYDSGDLLLLGRQFLRYVDDHAWKLIQSLFNIIICVNNNRTHFQIRL